MIVFVTTHSCRGTHKAVSRWDGAPTIKRRTYWHLFRRRSLPRATYILTDFDRLSPWELELAANLYRRLKAQGVRVLNDPGRFLPRHAMLEQFRRDGFNSFRSWSPASDEFPDRFPVFLRTQAAHRGPMTDLLEDAKQAQRALDDALTVGHALNDLHFIEYASEPHESGIFQKHSAFRLGDIITPSLSVFSRGWVAKIGDMGCASDAQYAGERAMIEAYPYADQAMRVFKAVDIDYGRIDFAFVDGRMETYEINTNPWMGGPSDHPNADRVAAGAVTRTLYLEALHAIDTLTKRPVIRLDGEPFKNQRRHDRRRLFTTRWVP